MEHIAKKWTMNIRLFRLLLMFCRIGHNVQDCNAGLRWFLQCQYVSWQTGHIWHIRLCLVLSIDMRHADGDVCISVARQTIVTLRASRQHHKATMWFLVLLTSRVLIICGRHRGISGGRSAEVARCVCECVTVVGVISCLYVRRCHATITAPIDVINGVITSAGVLGTQRLSVLTATIDLSAPPSTAAAVTNPARALVVLNADARSRVAWSRLRTAHWQFGSISARSGLYRVHTGDTSAFFVLRGVASKKRHF